MPKVNDVIYYKAGMSLGLGKPVFVTPFEKLDFPAQEHCSCFGGVSGRMLQRISEDLRFTAKNRAREVCSMETELLPLTHH